MSERNRIYGMVYNTNEKGWKYRTGEWAVMVTVFGHFLGKTLKGWWRLGPWKDMERFEVQVSVGGEDNMIQFGGAFPWLGRAYFGFRIPRALTRGWIYEKRYWAFETGMSWALFRLSFADERHMRDCGMVGYYRKKRERGEELSWNRVQLWPGFQWEPKLRLKDRLLGKVEYTREVTRQVQTVIPMPEGNYPCDVTMTRCTWERPRWPFSRKVLDRAEVEPEVAIPTPGKGENPWDIDDTGISSSTGPARSVAEAIGQFVGSCLRDRNAYAGQGWVPDKGWPEVATRQIPRASSPPSKEPMRGLSVKGEGK